MLKYKIDGKEVSAEEILSKTSEFLSRKDHEKICEVIRRDNAIEFWRMFVVLGSKGKNLTLKDMEEELL